VSKVESLDRFEAALNKAIQEGDLATAETAFDRYSRLLLDALLEGRPEEIERIETTLGRAFATMIVQKNIDPKRSGTSVAWTLAAGSRLASIAKQLRPVEPKTSHDAAAAEDKILLALAATNHGKMSNAELARACNLREETVARVLKRMRHRGSIESWKAGRTSTNQITTEGRVQANVVRQRDRVGAKEPTQKDRLDSQHDILSNSKDAIFIYQSKVGQLSNEVRNLRPALHRPANIPLGPMAEAEPERPEVAEMRPLLTNEASTHLAVLN